MSGSGRKHVSKWDSKEDTHPNPNPSVDVVISGSHYRDKEPYNADSNANASRKSVDDQQHAGQARTRSRASQNNDNSYYYSEQDETRQQRVYHRSDSRSYSRSRSRSRSPVYRARRDHAGSYDRHKARTRDDFNKRGGDQSSTDYGREDKARKPREMRYHSNDFREEEERSRRQHLQHDGVSDPRLRRHRSELKGEEETRGRDGDDGEGRFLRRSCDIPCKFFAAGNCRNGQHCRFSHHGGGAADRKHPQDNNNDTDIYRQGSNSHSDRWNGDERSDNGKFRKGVSENEVKGDSSWIDNNMEMSPDWNYGAHNLQKRIKEEEPGVGSIGQSSKSQVDDQRNGGVYSYGDNKPMVEKLVTDPRQNYNSVMNTAPVQAFSQSHNVLPYQNSLSAGGTQQQMIAPAAADYSAAGDNHHSVVEKAVPAQSSVTREQIDHISNISATIAQLLANGQAIPQLSQALQMPLHSESSIAVQPNHANNPLGMSTDTDEAPQVSNVDKSQELPVNPKAFEENGDTKTTNEASKEEDCKKAGEDGKDEDDDGSDEEEEDNKEKEKDTKGMKTFKFALVEIVKELLKPAWKEGKMNKDGYKNIVKKVVEKVTGSMQSGNVPTTQEKIDHYLSASKPKLTKLVQAYISKVKKT